MGVVNLTPDSFSGDGFSDQVEPAVEKAFSLIAAGADMLDIGAESTRPGAAAAAAQEEVSRLLPVLQALQDCGVPLSVDTRKPEVMAAVLAVGADMINDVSGFSDPAALSAVATSQCALCIMHMQGEPQTMQNNPLYQDVVAEVRDFLSARVEACQKHGIAPDRLVLDPGFGFGKTLEHNLTLFRRLHELSEDGLPLLVGVSRKSMLGAITGRPVAERLSASVAAALMAAQRGAAILRVHDVAATRDALAVWAALSEE